MRRTAPLLPCLRQVETQGELRMSPRGNNTFEKDVRISCTSIDCPKQLKDSPQIRTIYIDGSKPVNDQEEQGIKRFDDVVASQCERA